MKKIVAIILYCLIFTGCTAKTVETAIPSKPTDPPATTAATAENEITNSPATEETGSAEIITLTLYVPNKNADGFNVTTLEGENLTFLDAMTETDVLSSDIEINSISREENHLNIDFNQAFRDLVCTMGTSGERMIVGSVVNTLIANYDVETVSITIEGEVWESGHVIYDFPMGFFE